MFKSKRFKGWKEIPFLLLEKETGVDNLAMYYSNGSTFVIKKSDIAKCIAVTPMHTCAIIYDYTGKELLQTKGSMVTVCPWSKGIARQLIDAEMYRIEGNMDFVIPYSFFDYPAIAA